MIEKWLNYRAEKELNDFELKISLRILEISKLKIFEKNIFLGTVHVTLNYHLLKYSNTLIPGKVQALEIEIHSFEWSPILNLLCRVYLCLVENVKIVAKKKEMSIIFSFKLVNKYLNHKNTYMSCTSILIHP